MSLSGFGRIASGIICGSGEFALCFLSVTAISGMCFVWLFVRFFSKATKKLFIFLGRIVKFHWDQNQKVYLCTLI